MTTINSISKIIAVTVPPSNDSGNCSSDCPFFGSDAFLHGGHDGVRCSLDLGEEAEFELIKPGKDCPQYAV